MKPIRLISTLLVAALIVGTATYLLANRAAPPAASPPLDGWMEQFTLIDPPRPVPATPFRDADGRDTTLSDFAGRLVLVNFWATWCAPCVRELPSLDRLQAELGGDRFTVLAINEDRDGARVAKPFLEKLGLKHLTVNLDDKLALAQALGVRGMPTSYLIDQNGRVAGSLAGIAEWDSPEATALIRYYLDRGASEAGS